MIYCEDCSSYDCGCQDRKEIASLRQQLADRDAEVAELKQVMKFLATGNYDYQEELKEERDELRQQLAERENCGDEVEIIEKYPQSVAAWRRKAEELERQLAAFKQVAEVVKNPSSQIRIVNMDGNAFDLCDNVGLKLYANNNRDDAAH